MIKKKQPPYEQLFTLIVVVPYFLYVGYKIVTQKTTDTRMIVLLLIMGFYVVIIHGMNLIKMFKNLHTGDTFKRERGFFIILIGFLLLMFNGYFVYKHYFDKKFRDF